MKWLLLSVLFLYPVAQAMEPGAKSILDQYLNLRKSQTSPDELKKIDDQLHDLAQELDDLDLQNVRVSDMINQNQKNLEEKFAALDEVRAKTSSPYRAPEFRSKLVKKLSNECCRMVKDSAYRASLMEKIDERWEVEVKKYEKEQKEKSQTPVTPMVIPDMGGPPIQK